MEKSLPDNDVEVQVSRDEGARVQRESVIDEAVGEEQVVPVKQLSYNIHVKWPCRLPLSTTGVHFEL